MSYTSFTSFVSVVLYLAYSQFHNSIFYMQIGNLTNLQVYKKNGENRFLDSRLV
jgi:hypothetical protein